MIILTHVGNPVPNYVIYSLLHLRKHNKDADVVFILDRSIQNDNIIKVMEKYNVNVIDSRIYQDDVMIKDLNRLTWIKDLHPLGPPCVYGSQPNFWHLTMERLFYISAFMNNEGINNALHIENDNVLFYDYRIALKYADNDTVSCLRRSHYGESSTLFSIAAINNADIINRICSKILTLVAMGEKALQLKYGLSHISEMHLLNIVEVETQLIRYFPTLPDSCLIFDPYGYAAYLMGDNIGNPPGHIDTSDEIGRLLATGKYNIFFRDGAPYLSSKEDSVVHPIFNLHVHNKKIEKLL
jgi:hypothetical protein